MPELRVKEQLSQQAEMALAGSSKTHNLKRRERKPPTLPEIGLIANLALIVTTRIYLCKLIIRASEQVCDRNVLIEIGPGERHMKSRLVAQVS